MKNLNLVLFGVLATFAVTSFAASNHHYKKCPSAKVTYECNQCARHYVHYGYGWTYQRPVVVVTSLYGPVYGSNLAFEPYAYYVPGHYHRMSQGWAYVPGHYSYTGF
jgi:hypothetical protein